ncbi:putative ribonuclease H-like domain-containing protein, partial [Tanacetum coccineum]
PAYEVSTASLDVNTSSPQVSTASFSDNVVAKYEGKEECRAPRSKEGQFRNQDNTKKQGNNEDTSSKEMLAIYGVCFDWSDMAEEQVQTNMALLAFLDSEVYTDKTCFKTCLKNYETLKKQCDDLIVKLNQTEFTAATYKRGLATVEEQLITYRKNEVLFSKEVAVLKREVACKDYEINVLKSEFKKVKQEKEEIEFKIEKFDKASKDLDKLLGRQIIDKSKKGLAYNAIPPPHLLIYNRPKKLNLSYSGLDEFKDPEFKSYGSEDSKQKSKEFDGGYVTFGGGAHGGRISSKGTLKTDSLDFEDLPDESQILLKIPRKDNMYSFDMKNIVPKSKVLTCIFLTTKDETSEILKNFIKEIENLVDKKVKIIRSDNGTEFKNKVMDDFCREKGIRREYSVARTPQQNGVAERRNRTLIEAARTMLADSKLPNTFWAEAVSTACYVHNRVLVVKPHNKTPYELFRGFKPALSFMRPFGCHVTILNTLDSLGKFNGKSDEDVVMLNQHLLLDVKSSLKMVQQMRVIEKDKSDDDSSPKEVNTAGQHVNTARPEVNTGHYKLNTIDPSVNTDSSSNPDSPKDMFTMGASHTLEVTHVEFFSDEYEPEVDLWNILNSNTTRRMTKPTFEQGFLSAVYKEKTHDTLNTCLNACFLSQIEPTGIAKALSDSSWVEAMQEELLLVKLQ